ncbi:uncharacterized protein LOC122067043 [Macadamia integrifolia]|uniref:uncharacterized protein LOC122067043 n=1 Tax=Macadamia integrifolia TaxID=60698 RepID=UPI001C4F3E15|nr:uncharacterized protein LOC122067043 [Macadamia integrifolia]
MGFSSHGCMKNISEFAKLIEIPDSDMDDICIWNLSNSGTTCGAEFTALLLGLHKAKAMDIDKLEANGMADHLAKEAATHGTSVVFLNLPLLWNELVWEAQSHPRLRYECL